MLWKNILSNLSKSDLTNLLHHSDSFLSNESKVDLSQKHVDLVIEKLIQKCSHLLSSNPMTYNSFFLENDDVILEGEEKKNAESEYENHYK